MGVHHESARLLQDPASPGYHSGSVNDAGDGRREQGAGFWGSVFNLANAAVGAGILAFPYAFSQAGWLVGSISAMLFASILGYGLHVIGMASTEARRINPNYNDGGYPELVKTILGNRAEKVLTVLMIVYLLGSCIAYLNVMRDQAHAILVQAAPNSTWAQQTPGYEYIVPICSWGICFPLSLIPDMKKFAIPSTLSQGGIVFALGVIIYYSSVENNRALPAYGSFRATPKSAMDLFVALPLIAFSFQCHLTYPLVYASLKDRSLKNMDRVSVACMASCCLIYIFGGMFGYLLLGDATPDDIIEGLCSRGSFYVPEANKGEGCCTDVANIHNQSWANNSNHSHHPFDPSAIPCMPNQKLRVEIVASRIFIAVKVACSYAMLCFVCRSCIKDLIWGAGAPPFTTKGYLAETMVFISVTMLAAIYCPGIKVALGFVGIIVVVMTSIYPGWMLLNIGPTSTERLVAYGLIAFGIFAAGVGIVAQVNALTTPSSTAKPSSAALLGYF